MHYQFPGTLQTLEKVADIHKRIYKKIVSNVTVSDEKEAYIENSIGVDRTQYCSYVAYPRHPQARFQEPCGTLYYVKSLYPEAKKNYAHLSNFVTTL